MTRGVLTDEIKAKAQELLGDDNFTQAKLRFLPYVQYELMNNQHLDPRKLNHDERAIWSRWKQEGFVAGGAGERMQATRQFWDALNVLMWMSYVAPTAEMGE